MALYMQLVEPCVKTNGAYEYQISFPAKNIEMEDGGTVESEISKLKESVGGGGGGGIKYDTLAQGYYSSGSISLNAPYTSYDEIIIVAGENSYDLGVTFERYIVGQSASGLPLKYQRINCVNDYMIIEYSNSYVYKITIVRSAYNMKVLKVIGVKY